MKKLSLLTSSMLAIFLLTACSTQRFYLDQKSDLKQSPSISELQMYIIGGIAQAHAIDAAEVCGGSDKVVAVDFSQSIVDVLISFIPYNPIITRTARVYCKG